MEEKKCELLDHFAIVVQFFMALIAFSSLLYKRHREHPRRPFFIWFLDVSKQAIGGLIVHSCNVLFSLLAVSEASTFQNPCIYYFLNVLLDTTLGVLILILWLKVYHFIYQSIFNQSLVMGYYGNPPLWKVWVQQTSLFSTSLFSMKLCVVLLMTLVPGLETLGQWVLSPFKNPQVEVVFVMLLFPLIMNVVQFWLIDQAIKFRGSSDYSHVSNSHSIDSNLNSHSPSSVPVLGSAKTSSPFQTTHSTYFDSLSSLASNSKVPLTTSTTVFSSASSSSSFNSLEEPDPFRSSIQEINESLPPLPLKSLNDPNPYFSNPSSPTLQSVWSRSSPLESSPSDPTVNK